MSDSFVRLSWALPLVLLIGAVALLALRRMMPSLAGPGGTPAPAPELQSTLQVSEHTRLMVVRHRGREYLLLESSASAQLIQDMSSWTSPSFGQHGAFPLRRRFFLHPQCSIERPRHAPPCLQTGEFRVCQHILHTADKRLNFYRHEQVSKRTYQDVAGFKRLTHAPHI